MLYDLLIKPVYRHLHQPMQHPGFISLPQPGLIQALETGLIDKFQRLVVPLDRILNPVFVLLNISESLKQVRSAAELTSADFLTEYRHAGPV